MESFPLRERIRTILRDHGGLACDVRSLSDQADLRRAGLTSLATVNLLLALEDEFGVRFPDRLLRPDNFRSIVAIHAALAVLLRAPAPAPSRSTSSA